MAKGTEIVRVVAVGLAGLPAGAYGGALLFGDSFAGVPTPVFVALFVAGHAVAGFALGALAGRFWYVALLAAWGAALTGALYLQSGSWLLGATGLAGAPLAVAAGAWLGGRLTAGGEARPEP